MKPVDFTESSGGFRSVQTWPTNEDINRYPYFVHLTDMFYDVNDYSTYKWLAENIGERTISWRIFFNSNRVEYRFITAQDKMLFALRWC